ncbi:MAG: ATP-binding cassette domain-containing protein [Nitrospirales bacterium]|nr:ATP-binding cassette domain-containing protein [Nitrospira sp.]MDR4501539.1 ATP-binding cassette domain-containing protein [Nitrospirales bacterium]
MTKTFPDGTNALQDINWQVEVGETMVLIGESGSGKTTLLRLLNRLDEPTSGEILMMEEEVTLQNPITLRRQIGYVQQDGGLLPHWTVEQNVGLLPTLLGWNPEHRDQRIDQLLTLVGLRPHQYRSRYPITLSGGQRQRVAVARALAGDPDIVLLDEPFGALDALTRIELQEQFLTLKQNLNKTMVLVTHDLREAFYLGDRIAIMKDGRIRQIATPRELQEHPADDYVQNLLQHLPTT